MPPRRKAAAVEVVAAPKPKRSKVEQRELDEYAADETEMERIKAVMGISGFQSSKNKNHSASDCFAAVKLVKRKTARMVRDKTK